MDVNEILLWIFMFLVDCFCIFLVVDILVLTFWVIRAWYMWEKRERLKNESLSPEPEEVDFSPPKAPITINIPWDRYLESFKAWSEHYALQELEDWNKRQK